MSDAPSANHTVDDDQHVLKLNGLNGDDHQQALHTSGSPGDSPAIDSPTTLVSNQAVPDVKIDIDYQERESDARHEPLPTKLDKIENASTVPQLSTPPDPDSITIPPPDATPPPQTREPSEDVRMSDPLAGTQDAEEKIAEDKIDEADNDAQMDVPATPATEYPRSNGDISMDGTTPSATPIATPLPALSTDNVEMMNVVNSLPPPSEPAENEMDEDGPPPAKRARKHSDADQASLAHSATPPPASAVSSILVNGSPPVSSPSSSTFSHAQFRFCQSTIRQLKKMKDSFPFLRPVDPVALQIPLYPSIVKNPMDFSTIESKLNSSNPAKPDPNPANPRYNNSDEFTADVRLIFSNCLLFNGSEHSVTAMGKRVEEVFDRQIKHMPPPLEPKPVVVKKTSPPPPPPVPVPVVTPAAAPKKTAPSRRASTSVPVIRRSEAEGGAGRPKREIHPPPPKDLPYADAPKKQRKGKRVKDDGTNEQLRFCNKVLQDIHRKQHWPIASPFYEAVDWVTLDIPSYPKIIKKPMDLGTMRRKLEAHEYTTAQKFYDDFKLMIRNCFTFNPAGTPVNQAGIELQRLFDEKWKNLPSLHDVSDDEEDEDENDSEEERTRTIAAMESQIETMRNSISALKSSKTPKEKKKKEKRDKSLPTASSSKASSKPVKHSQSTKKKGKKPIPDDDVLSFQQKKDLSEAIAKLDGTKLEKVIQIIHEGVPEIRDSTEEIELEIDQLPSGVLTKLYNFVLRPPRSTTAKRNRSGKGTGTGGLKRKSMDEDVEAEKIRQLEERMRLFEPEAGGGSGSTPRLLDDSERSSDSSSGSDSSGSDSE